MGLSSKDLREYLFIYLKLATLSSNWGIEWQVVNVEIAMYHKKIEEGGNKMAERRDNGIM